MTARKSILVLIMASGWLALPAFVFGKDSSSVAFPGAEGFGALASGGMGGDSYSVSNLNDSGPGSFRDAVARPRRLIIFRVGGLIRLKSNIKAASDLSILGQTAPDPGITLYGHSISFSGCTNIIVRYLRIREGIQGDRGKCSVNITDGADMIFDHVSIEWGRWDCLGLTQGSRNMTFQYCIFGQGIDPQRFGALVDTVTNITLSHNLWIDNKSRNPKAKGTIQYINNVVYNWGANGLVGGHSQAKHELDFIGNYFIKGPSSSDRFAGLFASTDYVFQTNNDLDLARSGRPEEHVISRDEFRAAAGPATLVSKPFLEPPVPVTVDVPAVALEKIVREAGCALHRDNVDQSLIAELQSFGKSGHIIADDSGNRMGAARK